MAKIALDPNSQIDVLYNLGRRIALRRQQLGLTQLRLGFLSDTTQSYISDLEVGRRNPSIILLERIAKALKWSLSELLDGVDVIKQ